MAVNKEIIDVSVRGAKTVKNSLKGIGGMALKMGGMFFAAKGIVSGLDTVINSGSKLKSVELAFNNMGKSAGFTENALKKFQAATDGTVSKLELMTKTNNAMALGIVESEDQFAELLDTAQRLGAALGQDTVMALDSLVTGMGRQSKLMLDNLGIMVDTQKAYDDYAVTLGKTASELDDNEKKIAFNNAAMAEANRIVNEMGEEQLTTSQKIAKLKTTFSDMAMEIGKNSQGMFNSVVDAAQGVADQVAGALNFAKTIDFNATLKGFTENFGAIFTAWSRMSQLLIDFMPDVIKLLGQKFMDLLPFLADLGLKMIELLKQAAKFFWDPLVAGFKLGVNQIRGDWSITTQWLGDIMEMTGAKIKNSFTTILNGIKEGLNSTIKATNNLLGTSFETFELGELVDTKSLATKMDEDLENTRSKFEQNRQTLVDDLQNTEMVDFFTGIFGEGDQDSIDTFADFSEEYQNILFDMMDGIIVKQEEQVDKTIENKNKETNTIVKGNTDQETSTKKTQEEVTKSRKAATNAAIKALETLEPVTKKFQIARQGLAIKDTIANTYAAAQAQFKAYSESYPAPWGQIAGAAAAAAAIGAGLTNVGKIQAAKYGADFITNGPQMMLVGEGSGPEHVQVTPLVDENVSGPQGNNVTIQVQGSVIGTEDFTEDVLMPQIKEGLRLGNDMGV